MKRILVVSTIPTPPVQAGNQKCILEYCELLKTLGCEVHFLYVQGRSSLKKEAKEYWGDRLHVLKRNILFYAFEKIYSIVRAKITGHNHVDDLYPLGLGCYVKRLQKQYAFTTIIINYIILSKLFKRDFGYTKVLYAHDCMSFKKLRLGLKYFWFDLTPNQEARGLQRCDTVLSIQENESIYFKYLHPKGNIITVYSYFKIRQLPLTGNNNILFLSGDSILNVNGINSFINNVWPLVIKNKPEAKLIIAGGICKKLDIKGNGINLIGRVDKEEDLYKLGDIAINPIYQGTGLKIKTFEAMSYGRIAIVHPHSAEGIYNVDKAPLFIGNTSEEFADHIINMLENKHKREEYSQMSIRYIDSLNEYISEQYKSLI